MTRRTKLLGVVAIVGLGVPLVLGFLLIRGRTAPVTPTEHVPTTWETARKVPMHATHVERGKIACASCHVAGFDEKPTEVACAKCHSDPAAHAHRGNAKAPTTCLTCHVFAAGKPEPTCVGCHGTDATKATASANANPTNADANANANANEPAKAAHALARHVSKEAACSACHDVHGDKAAKTRTVLAECTACHTSVKVQHGRVATRAHVAQADAGAGDPRDAGDSFDAAVARFATDSRAASSLREGGGATAAATARVCTACHAPHAPAGEARDSCATCHVGGQGARAHASDADVSARGGEILLANFAPRVEPRGKHVAGHAACVTCHEPHRAEKADVRKCEDCHADHRSATTATGHTACTGCHTPHAPAEAKASCASAGCHAGKVALAAPRVAAHAECASCHDPHEPTASPALACVGCHDNIKAKHPGFASKTAGASTCVGCHAPHGGKPKAAASTTADATANACSTCHTKARTDRGFHAGGVACIACHKPHDFASNLLRTAAGTPAHGIPAPAAKGEEAALCAGCHAPKAAAVAARPGHAECGACHGAAHTPAKKPACVTCHAQETASAPRGHAACTQCHDSHSGSLGTHAVCTSCHAEKPKQQHGALAGAGCATCHTPHGPKGVATPPTCTSCHAKPKLEGLHSVAAHNTSCASCHGSHSAPRSDRATCTSSCHLDRRDHQPAAKVCKGCHMFRN
jgi:hypothetical protein